MLSDEEKKAIAYLKFYIERDVMYEDTHYEQIKTILNLIEKQQKEIEELKNADLSNSKIIANMSERHFHDREKIRKYEALQDKIKAKIEELENDPNNLEEHNCLRADTCYVINVLQSLLEKE